MKILSCALLLMACTAFVLVGCSDNSGPVAASSDQTMPATGVSGAIGKMGTDLHAVTGSAHWRVIGAQTRVRFSFSAIQHADGSVSGEVLDLDEGPVIKLHGKVYDLKVEGNKARISFNITRGVVGGSTDLAGWVASFVVVDNGEGRNASGPDEVSLITGDVAGADEPAISMTIEEFNALGVDEYITNALILWGGIPLAEFLPAIEQGSVRVR